MRIPCLALAAAGIACSSEPTSSGGALAACSGAVAVSVASGAQPTVTWTPACKLFFLNVEPVNSGADQWSVITDSANAIAPPVKYGVTPPGAVQLTAPASLLVGQAYNVYVFRWTGPGRQDGVLIGTGTFTR
jgi:hypothetical protein